MTPIISTALLGTQSDERLLALAQSGHERAFEAIVQRYRAPLRLYVRRLLGARPVPALGEVVPYSAVFRTGSVLSVTSALNVRVISPFPAMKQIGRCESP